MCNGFTRREFLKNSLVGGVTLGMGLGHVHWAHAQTNLRFSTWHVPVGRDVQTVWIPMMEELKKRSKELDERVAEQLVLKGDGFVAELKLRALHRFREDVDANVRQECPHCHVPGETYWWFSEANAYKCFACGVGGYE